MSVKKKFNKEFGVSETIGFIIIFGIVMTGISIVALYGYPALLQEQQNANVKNMEKNMLVLQSDVHSLIFKSVPYQETSIQVSGGTLMLKPPSSNSFQIVNGSDITPSIPVGQILYVSSDNTASIGLENGAVHIRYWSSPNGSAMISTPQWFYDTSDLNNKTYVIQFITLDGSPYLEETGIGNVRLALNTTPGYEPSQIIHDILPAETITVVYNQSLEWNYGVAWKDYFSSNDLKMTENTDFQSHHPGSIAFNLDSGANKLVIKRYNITVLSV
jgi:hypothetical protein